MGAFGWTVVGSVAGVVAAVAAVVAVLQARRKPAVLAGAGPVGQAALGRGGVPVDAPVGLAVEVPVVAGDIPQEPAGFQPRANLLAELDAPLWGRVSVVHAVTGMRGVGKTQLAAAYARARLARGWRLVAWINAEDRAAVLGGLAVVAAALDLDDGSGDAGEAARAVRHFLETGGHRCLLVFDNATDPEDLLAFLPAAGAARVLITSNDQAMTDLGAGVAVDVFTEAEALAFLADRTGSPDTEGARLLAAELGRLPLALAQAAAVIAAQHLEYATYLRRLRDKPVDELLLRVGGGQYPRGLAAAVVLSLDAVRAGDDTGACGAVMGLVCVLSAAGVPRALLHTAGQAGAPAGPEHAGLVAPEVVDAALGRLAGASLLTFSLDGSAVSAHRLVMRVIRENLAANNSLLAVCAAAAQLLQGHANSLSGTWHEDRAAARDLAEQIMALYESSAASPADSALDRRMLRLRRQAVWFLNELGDSAPQVIVIGEQLVADQERVLGPDHPDTLTSRNDLAIAYWDVGRTDEAITLHEQTLTDQEQTLGPDHPETLRSRNNLAYYYYAADRTGEAIALHEQTLADCERILGPGHLETLRSRNNLALDYQDAGRTGEAITLHEQTLTDQEQTLGPDHPDTLTSRYNLAIAYWAAGRTNEAITLYEQALADYERILGPDHPDTLSLRNKLANAHRDAGRTGEGTD